MERALSVLSVALIAVSVAASVFALGRFAAADDLRGLLFVGIALCAGLSALRMHGSAKGDD